MAQEDYITVHYTGCRVQYCAVTAPKWRRPSPLLPSGRYGRSKSRLDRGGEKDDDDGDHKLWRRVEGFFSSLPLPRPNGRQKSPFFSCGAMCSFLLLLFADAAFWWGLLPVKGSFRRKKRTTVRSSGSRGIFGYGPFLRVVWHLVFTTTSPKKVQRARHCNLRIMTALWFRQNFHLKSQKKFEQSWELW